MAVGGPRGERRINNQQSDSTTSFTAARFRVDSTAQTATVAATVPALQALATRPFDRLLQIPDWLPTPEHRRGHAPTASTAASWRRSTSGARAMRKATTS